MKNRPYTYYDHTTALCSQCLKVINAKIIFQNDNVYMLKNCLEHGIEQVLMSDDIAYYKRCRDYVKPSEMPQNFNTQTLKGCPYDCGLCPDHEQHSCLTILEITDSCNLQCPVCYAQSSPENKNFRSLEQLKFMLHAIIQNEVEPDIVQISGGEPTLHPQFFEIMQMVKNSPVRHVMLNTNGIKIANDEKFVEKLASFSPGFEVYLQFDGFEEETFKQLRGVNLASTREKAIKHLNQYNISTTLVVTLKKGLNDKEIGNILDYAINQRCVRGVTFQPVQDEGRTIGFLDKDRLVLSEVRRNIIEQSTIFNEEDIIPVPCHPDCLAMGYTLKLNGKIIPLTGMIDPDILLEGGRNTIVFESDQDIKNKIFKLFSLNHSPQSGLNSLHELLCCLPKVMVPENLSYENVFRVLIMKFMDRHDMDIRSVKKSCVHIAHPDGRIIPFDTYNLLYR